MKFAAKLSVCLVTGVFLVASCTSSNENQKKTTSSSTKKETSKDDCSTSSSSSKKSLSSKKTLRLQDEKVTYESDIKELIDDNCISCHGKGQSSPDMSSYDSMKDEFESIFSEVDNGTMPQAGPLPDAEKEKFTAWKANKFAENDSSSTDETSADEEETESEEDEESNESDTAEKEDEEKNNSSSSKCSTSKTSTSKKTTTKDEED